MIRMRERRTRLLVRALTMALLWCQAALADEGGLILPILAGDDVVVTLPEDDRLRSAEDYSDWFQVFVGPVQDCCAGKTPVAGRYKADVRSVRFSPGFEFVGGQEYVVRLKSPDASGRSVEKRVSFSINTETPVSEPGVTAVYPSGDLLPENILRFYLHFSTPMQPNVAFDYIKLVDESGHVDTAAFMQFKQELWNEDRTRLTLLMDPGRIKRGVATNLELGPALHEGNRYRLVVEPGWPSASGVRATEGYSKPFRVSAPLRLLPDPRDWQVTAPALHTYGRFEVQFDRVFDVEQLRKSIRLWSPSGEEIEGEIHIEDNERRWVFRPDKPWSSKQVRLVVNSELEDVAGNNLRDLLDHSIDTGTKALSSVTVMVELSE